MPSPTPAWGGADVEPGQRPTEAVLYCNVGDVTNLAVARGRACLFTRVSHAGLEAIAERLAGARGLSAEHAAQWLAHVGVERPVEEIEGDPETIAGARQALEEGVSTLLDEMRLSLDYYGAQESALPVGQDRPLRAWKRDPRLRAAHGGGPRHPDRGRSPRRPLRHSTTTRRPASRCPTASLWRAEPCAR